MVPLYSTVNVKCPFFHFATYSRVNLKESLKKKAVKIMDVLAQVYPEVKPALEYKTPFQLLIATILSAQCTDARVNVVTKDLFKKYKSPEDFINTQIDLLEKDIFSTGFYKQKAKSIISCCKVLVDSYNGKVPEDFDELVKLPGVGRKTASVIAGNAFGIPAIAVDTHVIRLSNLLGLVDSTNPEKIESQLKDLLPEAYWINASHWLATHGRNVCIARRPKCFECPVTNLCPAYNPESEIKYSKK